MQSSSWSRIPGFNFATCNAFNTLHFHSNANKKVIYTQCTFVLFSHVFANQNPGLRFTFPTATPASPPPPPPFFLNPFFSPPSRRPPNPENTKNFNPFLSSPCSCTTGRSAHHPLRAQSRSRAGFPAPRSRRQARHPRKLERKSCPREFLGHVVRAVPRGDSRSCRTAKKIQRPAANSRPRCGRRRSRRDQKIRRKTRHQLSRRACYQRHSHSIRRNSRTAHFLRARFRRPRRAKARRTPRSSSLRN